MDNQNGFVGYEYKDISVPKGNEYMYIDSYQSFGFILENSMQSGLGTGSVTLKFKRDRKIRNKAELTRLQRQFDALMVCINELENSKTNMATIVSLILGMIGTAFMAGSVFAITSNLVTLCIILAVPAFTLWILPYFCYRKMVRNKTVKVTPLIDQKYDEIYETCEKASRLSAN